MTKELVLNAQTREKTGGAIALKKEGFIVACMYGPGSANVNLKIKRTEFEKIFSAAGESHLIDLVIGGKGAEKVLVKDIQKDSVKNIITHVDFYKVDMNKKITAEIPLHFVGESRAVKELGGTLIKDKDSIEVKCLAQDLADFIEVDISVLKNLHDAIRISDLKLPKGMEVMDRTDEQIVGVHEQKVEEEKPAVAAEAAAVPAAGTEEKKEVKKEEKKK